MLKVREVETMRGSLPLGVLVLIAGSAAQPAFAQEGAATRSVTRLLDCRSIGDDRERLRCYDQAAGTVADARRSGELVTLDRSKVVAARRQGFGLPAPRTRVETTAGANADALAALHDIEGTIVEVRAAEYGRFLIALDRNGVWKNVDPLTFPPSKGATMRVTRSGFGGFRATIGKGKPFLIKRER